MSEKREKSVVVMEILEVSAKIQATVVMMKDLPDESDEYKKAYKKMQDYNAKMLILQDELRPVDSTSYDSLFDSVFKTILLHPTTEKIKEKVDGAINNISDFVDDVASKAKTFTEDETPGSLTSFKAVTLYTIYMLLCRVEEREKVICIIVDIANKMIVCESKNTEVLMSSFEKLKKAGFDEETAFRIIQRVTRFKSEKKAE